MIIRINDINKMMRNTPPFINGELPASDIE